jgi:hypothetical protein
MRARPTWLAAVAVALVVAGGQGPQGAFADTLSGALKRYVNDNATIVQGQDVGGASLSTFIERLAARGTALPATSTLPGFTYRYNVDLGLFEREAGALGPALLDRGDTLGKGRFAVGMSYLYADLTQFDGSSFARQVDFGSVVPTSSGDVAAVLTFRDFDVRTNIVTLFATYGLTDRWDVNVLMPLVHTKLEVDGQTDASVGGARQAPIFSRLRDEAFGFGDVLLRTKYRLVDDPVSVATGLTLRTPTGREDQFAGLGDFTVEPIAILSKTFGRNDVHANLGIEVNADDLQRTRGRYGVGISFAPIERFALLFDFFGSSAFVEDDFSVNEALAPGILSSSNFLNRFSNGPGTRVGGVVRTDQFIPRTDIVDASFGFKVNFFRTATAFASAIIPVVHGGLRAPVVPTGGVQYTF